MTNLLGTRAAHAAKFPHQRIVLGLVRHHESRRHELQVQMNGSLSKSICLIARLWRAV